MPSPSSFDPTRDYDQEAKDARIDAPSTLYRYAVEYTRYGNRGNVFVRGVDEKDACAQFKMLYPGASLERIMSLGEVR